MKQGEGLGIGVAKN